MKPWKDVPVHKFHQEAWQGNPPVRHSTCSQISALGLKLRMSEWISPGGNRPSEILLARTRWHAVFHSTWHSASWLKTINAKDGWQAPLPLWKLSAAHSIAAEWTLKISKRWILHPQKGNYMRLPLWKSQLQCGDARKQTYSLQLLDRARTDLRNLRGAGSFNHIQTEKYVWLNRWSLCM